MLEHAERGQKLSRQAFEALEPDLRVSLLEAQAELRERGRRAVLVVLTGDDRIGCDEVFDLLHEWLDARRLVSRDFADPPAVDLERPFAYRFWRELPPRGQIGIFFGAWPAAALLERCRDGGDEALLDRRIEDARALEQLLADDGLVLLKLWLHLSKQEHAKRLARARKDPEREILVEELDREILEDLDESLPEVERYLAGTHRPHAPWHVIRARDEARRDLRVGELLLAALREAAGEPGPGSGAEATGAAEGGGRLATLDLSLRLEPDDYERRLDALQLRLAELSRRARRAGLSTVLAFEGWDAAGKGGAIRRLTRAMAARDCRVVPIGAPTPEELARPYLWRFWRELPRAGRAVLFDRSWYGRVLVERVEGFARPEEWGRAYAEIAAFETELTQAGIVVRKFWLHIDQDEQLRRFEARERTAFKHHKLTAEDHRNRERWPDYLKAADELLARTDLPAAPWTVVPANDKRWARVRVLETVVEALERGLS